MGHGVYLPNFVPQLVWLKDVATDGNTRIGAEQINRSEVRFCVFNKINEVLLAAYIHCVADAANIICHRLGTIAVEVSDDDLLRFLAGKSVTYLAALPLAPPVTTMILSCSSTPFHRCSYGRQHRRFAVRIL